MNILLAADVDGAVGGINIWAKHIYDYSKGQDEINIDTAPDKRKDFTHFTSSSIKRILDGIHVYVRYVNRIRRLLSEKQYDVLHIPSSASLGLIRDYCLIKLAKRKHTSAVLHFHFGRIPVLSEKKNWEWKLLCKVSRMADYVIVLDQKSYITLNKAGIASVTKLPNPISTEVVEQIEKCDVGAKNKNEVLYVGQCYQQKGIFDLLEACKNISDVKIKYVGSISEDVKGELIDLAGDQVNIEIAGLKPYSQIVPEMKKCSVFVLPSHSEGFPNVILESMACGCAIVATQVGAIPEMLNAESGTPCGLCVEPKDTQRLTNAIQTMLEDQDFARACGERAKERVNQCYSMQKVWYDLVNIWKNSRK